MGNCRVTLCGVKLISIRWDESGEPVDGGRGGGGSASGFTAVVGDVIQTCLPWKLLPLTTLDSFPRLSSSI